MRPFGLLLAACLCSLLLYDRLAGRFPTAVLAAGAAPAPWNDTSLMNRPYPSQETRLQKLQHFQVASQLLDAQRQKVRDLEKEQNEQLEAEIKTMFAEQLSKDLLATWERMNDHSTQLAWQSEIFTLPQEKKEALRDQERKNEELLKKQKEAWDDVLHNPQSAAAKSLNMRVTASSWYNHLQKERELRGLFLREVNAAGAALKESH
jgi:hypothetical protein